MTRPAVLHLTVGLPGAGKTTWATQIADDERILRLTPDEWMGPLFGHSDADGRRDVLEGRLIWVAHEVLRSGASVVLDFGCWTAAERYAIRAVAELVGARFELHYATVPEHERRARVRSRWETAPETTFEMSEADNDQYVAHFEPPTAAELEGAALPDAPAGSDDWFHWASQRWPSLPRLDRT